MIKKICNILRTKFFFKIRLSIQKFNVGFYNCFSNIYLHLVCKVWKKTLKKIVQLRSNYQEIQAGNSRTIHPQALMTGWAPDPFQKLGGGGLGDPHLL